MKENTNKFFDDMAEDFFAECEELLAAIKRCLLIIDSLSGSEKPPLHVIEELLRSFHTLKGLTGMIGAEHVMLVAHSVENYLKVLNEQHLAVPSSSRNTLFKSVLLIESQLSSLRSNQDIADPAEIISELDAVLTLKPPEGPESGSEEKSHSAPGNERSLVFSFSPSKELFERGININVVRQRLSEIGRITSSVPHTAENGHISFEFIVETAVPEHELSDWNSDGMSCAPLIQERAAISEKQEPAASRINVNPASQKNIVRVDLNRLEDLMRSVGDLVVSRSRLNESIRTIDSAKGHSDISGIQEINVQIERQVKELSEGIMKLRLISVGESFERMRFVVRDLVSKSGKLINLVFHGEDTQIDKFVMEKMFDPLLHLVRNAVSHGIEPPSERESLGKNHSGQILLSASASGNTVVFEVSDDGYGINPETIIEKALRSGLIDNATGITNADLLRIMTAPGFSTREESDMASGRGMGMDIVSRTVTELGGTMEMDSVRGSGTRFTIQLPLILSIVNALIINSALSSFAIPMPAVNEIISIEEGDVVKFMSDEMIFHQGSIIPVMRLDRYFNLGSAVSHYVVVVESGHERAGIIVDRIIGKREIVVRSLSDPLVRVAGISGATELGDGRIVLILDTTAIVRSLTSGKKLKKETTI